MSKKRAGGLLGTLLVAGVAAGIVKYLRDYSDASFADEEQIDKVKKNTDEVKNAAKRTYVAIREKGDVMEAAEELAKAAGSVVSDSAGIAMTAGAGAVRAAKDIKSKFDEDPEAARDEMLQNLKEMGSGISQKVSETAEDVVERFRGGDEFTDFEDSDFEDIVKDTEEAAEAAGEAAQDAASCACETAEDVLESARKAAGEAAEEAAGAVGAAVDKAAEEAGYAADKAGEEAIAAADMIDELSSDAAEAVREAAKEAEEVLNAAPSVTITDDEVD